MPAHALLAADTSTPLDRRAIGRVLREQAALRGDAPALYWLDGDGSLAVLSYRSLYDAAARLATRWRSELPAGSRIGVWSANTPEWVVLEYAVALAGAMLTPINPALTDDEVRPLLVQSGAVLLYASETFRGSRLLDRATSIGRGLGVQTRRLAGLLEQVEQDGPSPELPPVDAKAPFLLQYTSGTTGRPKGVVLTHQAAFNSGLLSAERLGLTDKDVWLCPLPLHHVGGSVCMLLPVLAVGGALALAAGWDVERVVQLAAASQSTVLGVVPTMMIDLADHPAATDGRLSSIRILQGGGSTVAPALIARIEQILDASVVVGYGQSEAPVSISGSLTDSLEDKATTIGRPLAHREVRIADPVTGETLLCGEIGELQIRSPLSMSGYWLDPEATAAAFDADGWLHSGDLCSLDERGMLSIHGRYRDLIIRGGENIYPGEVEETLLAHPCVDDVAVIGAPSERWGEEVVAFVRASEEAVILAADLDEWARTRLASYKRPRAWYLVDEFPLTPAGKVQKFVLREWLADDREVDSGHPDVKSKRLN